ncbi:ribonuclease R [Kistimonas asteriae]|uniref:ribonuclease R n=1 Tax=Kistimonas asteriae TaxID=517724 RepID=UPI001BAA2450|nr:ribonuclease R [Kistimonas asteriae]
MPEWWRDADPNAKQEKQSYDNPVPSRALIMSYLDDRGAPATHDVLCREFELEEDDQVEALRRRLIAMARDGQLIQTRRGAFGLLNKMDLITGKVQGHRDGFGFVLPDGDGDDLFLTSRQMGELYDGDRVVVRETDVDNRGRRYCAVVEILERSVTQVVGKYFERDGTGFVEPDHRRMTSEIMIKPGPLLPLRGQYVVVEIIEYPTRRALATGIVKEILGDKMAPGMEVEIAVRSHNIPHTWPEDVEAQVSGFSPNVPSRDKKHRVDLRELPFVTIDGEDARDFDDAVYCEKKRSGGWRLFVAIADVSHYVKPGTALDDEANNRGTSVYFPGHVIPMLPEVLSNGLCSLNPKVDRLAMVCEMTISGRGKISGYQFYEGLIQSHARLTYTEVSALLEHPESPEGLQVAKTYGKLVSHLNTLYTLYKVLHAGRVERGAIDFDTVETRIVFSEDRKIEKIVPTERNDAHRLIEECMLCANVATARFLEKHALPALYRIHEGPSSEKLENLYSFLGELGLFLPGKTQPEPSDYQQLLERIKDRPDFLIIQTMLLRSLSQAVYSPDNIGHFGLAYPAYAHFTSPIRRYPDLLVHRAIRYVIRSELPSRHVKRVEGATVLKKQSIFPYETAEMLALGEHCSMAERRADDATRDAMDSLKCQYMQGHIGEVYDGLIATVTGFGLFVELNDIYVTGLVHISNLPGDYYHFESSQQRLVGERTAMMFRLGDALRVRVVRVDLDEKTIDFELEDAPQSRRKGRTTARKQETTKDRRRAARTEDRPSGKKPSRKKKVKGGKASGNKKAKAGSKPAKKTTDSSTRKAIKKPAAKKGTGKAPARTPRKRSITR